MGSIHNLKIGVRLALVFALIILVTGFGFLYTSLKTRSIKNELDKIYKINLLSMEYLIEADRDAYQSSIAISQILANTEANNSELLKAVDENIAQVEQRYSKFETISDVVNLATNRNVNQQFHDNHDKIKSLTSKITQHINQKEYQLAKDIYFGEYAIAFQAMRDAMDQFTGISLDNAEKSYNESISASAKILANSIIITILIILFIIFSGIVITNSITKPVEFAVQFLDRIANGDLTVEVKKEHSNRKDEVGNLLNSMSGMVIRLNELITKIKANASIIINASQELSSSSQQLSEGANEQASSVEEVSSTMEEITSNIQQNTQNAVETQKIANISSSGISEVNFASQENLKSIKMISDKISIINDIAFQTNILALNAAVEAARAGEHGKGFAVVASEVRKLAEHSKIAADEIINLLSVGVKTTQDMVSKMDSITPEIAKTSSLVQEIAAASQEQSNGSNQVNNAIQQLNILTQQNASVSEELAANAKQLSDQADSLFEMISVFKTSEDSGKMAHHKPSKSPHTNKPQNVAKTTIATSHEPTKKSFKLDLSDDKHIDDKDFEKF
ncbi:chemotaxis protein [Tenuifilaceae bacterium CYCD]|nr:chemotaxis protein [Tenuifilaceae bacterium CYCD]